MARLTDLLDDTRFILLTGPYGTEIAERVAKDIAASPQLGSGILHIEHLGAGCSALLSEKGRDYVRQLTQEYVQSVPPGQAIALVLDTFRLPKQVLETAASAFAIDPHLYAEGLNLNRKALGIALEAVAAGGRTRENTAVVASIGPPFDCYKGEETPADAMRGYAPQVFSTVRFLHDVDTLLFETVPSLKAAIGATEAFAHAHKEFDVPASTNAHRDRGVIAYWGRMLESASELGDIAAFAPTYKDGVFTQLRQGKDYIISFCLDKEGRLHDGKQRHGKTMTLQEALDRFDAHFARDDDMREGAYMPLGFGINCNNPDVTRRALEQLPDALRSRIVSIHPNATRECDPRQYCHLTARDAMSDGEFATRMGELWKDFRIPVVGGCCGTHPGTMRALYDELNARYCKL